MFQMIDPPVLLTAVPVEVAYPIGAAGAAAITMLWRRQVFLEDRSRADRDEMLKAINEAHTTQRELLEEMRLWRTLHAQAS